MGSYRPRVPSPRLADGQHADGAGDHGSLVGQDVAEHVLGDHHVELGRGLHDLHGAVVHEHLARSPRRGTRPAGGASRSRHRRLVSSTFALSTQAQLLTALLGGLESRCGRCARSRARSRACESAGLASHRVPASWRLAIAEVHAADELTHDHQVDALRHDLRLQGAGRAASWGADLGRDACWSTGPSLARMTQQALLRALFPGQCPPTWGRPPHPAARCRQPGTCPASCWGRAVAARVDGVTAHAAASV